MTLHDYMNLTTGASADQILSLDTIRSQLIRLEDTIIFRTLLPSPGLGPEHTETDTL